MHQLFYIRELVAMILAADRQDNSLLQSCLRVNRSFSHEAVRLLWHKCGVDYPVTHSYKDPTIMNLAKLAVKDLSRAQYYANFIHELSFICHEEKCSWQPGERPYIPWMKLQFPNLRSLNFDCSEPTLSRPGRWCSTLLVEWLEHLQGMKDSPYLKNIHLALDCQFSFEGVEESVWFKQISPILSTLSVELYWDWPPAFLKALAVLPALRKFAGRHLDAELLRDLPKGAFPVLKELATMYIGAVDMITSLFPQLLVLKLVIPHPMPGDLTKLVGLDSLTSITIEFGCDYSITSSDLLALSQGCPKLEYLHLPPIDFLDLIAECPTGEDIDDATMEQFARSLAPQLKGISFGIENFSALTQQSIISLARHCPKMEYCHIAADIFIPELVEGLEDVSRKELSGKPPLPSITIVGLYFDNTKSHAYSEIDSLARRFVKLAPDLCGLSVTAGSEDDFKFKAEAELLAGLRN